MVVTAGAVVKSETVPTEEDDSSKGSSTAVLLKEAVGYTGGEVVVTKVVGSRDVLPRSVVLSGDDVG